MKLQSKFNLGIVVVFAMLAVLIAAATFFYLEADTIREAENRVRTYTRAAWEIYSGKIAGIHSAAEVLAYGHTPRDILKDPDNEQLSLAAREQLEAIRQGHDMDILSLLAPDGAVLLRTRSPYNKGDNLADDPMIRQVIETQESSSGTELFDLERMDAEGSGLAELSLAVAEEPNGMFVGAAVPVMEEGELIGIVQMGSLVNGDVEVVDRIRDAVFENEYYKGKPVGTATIFMGDLRISTNVSDNQGRRALGTRVSEEVAEQVLGRGVPWTGRAHVVDTWYLSQYDPIRDPDGEIIGMVYVGELEQKYLDHRPHTLGLYLSIISAGTILALVIFVLLARPILRAIQQLSEATERISSGDLGYRVAAKGKDEVGQLSASFNLMAEQLETQHREIERRQQELEVLNDELRRVNRNYMDMLGFVSHELKNPLASAILSLHTVKDGYLGELSPGQIKSLETTARSLDYFQDMIRNYLDLSRLEKGELEVHKTQFPLQEHVVLPAVEAMERELQERQITIDNRVPGALVLNADPSLLRIVYDNLLSNAAKYGRAGGVIVLDAQQGGDRTTLSVRNDGEGIPPDKMAGLFRKFSRLDSPESAGQRGTGLGLYICKQIVEKHGGEMWADSKTGEWVQFSFTIPN